MTGVCTVALSIGQVTAGTPVRAAELNQLIDLLEGDVGETLAFLLRVAANEDFQIILADAAGSSEFIIKDSGGNIVFSVDSDGNVTQAGTFDPGSLTLAASANPTPTTEGAVEWDSDDDEIVVGNGSGQTRFLSQNKVWRLVGSDTTERSTNNNGAIDLSTVTLTEAVPAAIPLLVEFSVFADFGSHGAVLGFGLNSTTVISGQAISVAADTQGSVRIYIPPRETNYLQASYMHGLTHTVGSATEAVFGATPETDAPTADITQVVIRGGIASGTTTTLFIKNVYVYRLAVE